MKESQKAVSDLMEIVTELAQIVATLDPGRTETYARIEYRFEKAREHLARASAYEG